MDSLERVALTIAPLSVIFVSLLWNRELLLTGVLAFLGILLFVPGRKKDEISLFWFGFVFGPLAESIAIYFGAWKYSNTSVFNFPLWLPFLWAIATVFVNRIHVLLLKIVSK